MFIRVLGLIWGTCWLLALAAAGWLLLDQARRQKRRPPVSEVLLVTFVSFISWPLFLPAFVLYVMPKRLTQRGRQGLPWWVMGVALLVVLVMLALFVASVVLPVYG